MDNTFYNKILEVNKDNNINLLIYSNSDYELKNIYNFLIDRNNVKREVKEIIYRGKSIFFTLYYNQHFMELNLEEVYSRRDLIIKDFIKYITSFSLFNVNKIVIHNIDLLTKKEQFILRKVIEKANSFKFILFSKNINNLINPIVSRCLTLNIRDMNEKEINELMKDHPDKKKIFKEKLVKNFYNIKKIIDEQRKKKLIEECNVDFKYCDKEGDIDLLINEIVEIIRLKTKLTNILNKKISENIESMYKKYHLEMEDIIKKIYYIFYQYIPNDKYVIFNKIVLDFTSKLTQSTREMNQVLGFIYHLKYEYNNSK